MSYALTTLWHERQRYLTAILAVAFCALLGSVQFGLLLGLFSITSMPVDTSRADIWLGAPKVLGVDLGRPIRESQALARLASHPDIERVEGFLQGFSYWARKDGGQELCMVVGSRLEPGSMGRNTALERYPELAEALTEPGTVVFDESDKEKLGVQKAGDEAEVAGSRVRVVGFVKGAKGLAAPFVFCSLTTARPLLRCFPGQITYALGKVKKGASPEDVVASLRRQYAPAPPKADPLASKDMGALSIQTESQKEAAEENALGQDSQAELSIFTSAEFSRRTRVHWLTKTKGGFALGYAAVLGLMVGAVVTSQTLYSATAASIKEFAVLKAMGIPRWRVSLHVMTLAAWVGIIGIVVAIPAVFSLAAVAEMWGVQMKLEAWLLITVSVVTLFMAIGAGLFALRSLRGVEPALLLR